LPPSPLDIAHGKQGGVREDFIWGASRVEKFVERIGMMHIYP